MNKTLNASFIFLSTVKSIFMLLIPMSLICLDDSLAKKLQTLSTKSPPSWMLERIEEDLAPYKENGISQEALDKLASLTQDKMTVRIKILSGEIIYQMNPFFEINKSPFLNFYKKRFEMFLKGLAELVNNISLPDIDFIVNMADCESDSPDLYPAPLFVFSKNRFIKSQALIPDCEAMQGYARLDKMMEQGEKLFPWECKKEKIFWRGATTDGWYNSTHWESNPRAKLVCLSLLFPDSIDARFTTFCHGAETNVAILAFPEILANFTSQPDSLSYKYLMDIDGWTCSWSRCYWTLLSNSVVFKQITDDIQWFYGGLQPYYHYIPVKKDLSDLLEQLQWSKKNDQIVKNIATQGTYFVKNNLSKEMILFYTYCLLIQYSKLQKF